MRELAEDGPSEAMYQLGLKYRDGMGEALEQDRTEAIRWFERAAQKGHAQAAIELEKLRRSGPATSEARPPARTEARETPRPPQPGPEEWVRAPTDDVRKSARRRTGFIVLCCGVGFLVGGGVGLVVVAPDWPNILGAILGALLGGVVIGTIGAVGGRFEDVPESEKEQKAREMLRGGIAFGVIGGGIAGWIFGPQFVSWRPTSEVSGLMVGAIVALLGGVLSWLGTKP
jgi:TPR repeat protein